MRLVRLLAVGKSLIGLQQVDGRYRLTRKRLLPKFPANKNPFRATARPAMTVGVESELPGLRAPVQREAAVTRGAEAAKATSAGPASQMARRVWTRWFGGGTSGLGGQSQGELSLEHVKVVRNDLSHYDNEPVGRKPLGAVVQEKQRQLHLTPRPAGVLPGFELEPKPSFLTGRRG